MATETKIPTTQDWTLGRRLEEARRLAGLTQEEMARQFNKSSSTITKWENDRGQARGFLSVIAKWAEITGVDELWLLKGDAVLKSRGSSALSSGKGSRPTPNGPGRAQQRRRRPQEPVPV